MMTKKQIAEALKDRLADVAVRGRVVGQALKVRADLAATRRRVRTTFAELGEEVYGRLQAGELDGDARLNALKERIDGFKAEVRMKEEELREIMRSGFSGGGDAADAAVEDASPAAAVEAADEGTEP